MKKFFYTWITVGILLVCVPAIGQKTVIVVQPDAGIDVGALNAAIAGAADPGNTIFELKRGGVYYLNGAISHSGYTLHIRAEEGDGIRPVLQPAVDDIGVSANHFNTGGSLILEGIYIQGRDELGYVANQQIIVSGEANRIIIDDCIFDYSNQAFIRLTSINNAVYITNSILRNSLRTESLNNGRIIDTRSNPTDTLLMENSTIYNCGSSQFLMGAGLIKYVKWNHNTFFQGSYSHAINLGASFEVVMTNNLLYNFGYRANDYSHDPLFTVDSIFTIGEYTDAERSFNFKNNNWYTDPVIGDILDEYGIDQVRYEPWDTEQLNPIPWRYVLRQNLFADLDILDTSTVTAPPKMVWFLENGQVDTTNFFSEKLIFDNSPPLNLGYWTYLVENNYTMTLELPPSPFADEDPNVVGEVTTGAYTFNYTDNSISATAADGGLPLGDPRWAPYSTVLTEKVKAFTGTTVRTYPNPVSGQVTFEIDAQVAASVRINMYDLTGKEVFKVDERVNQGMNTIHINLNTISRPGIYLYQVQAKSANGMQSFTSGKIVKR